MSLPAVIDLSQTVISRLSQTQSAVLTSREREVLEHLVLGLSDREIADALFVSHRTVETHVSNVIAKFGVRTRAQAASIAIATGLALPPNSVGS